MATNFRDIGRSSLKVTGNAGNQRASGCTATTARCEFWKWGEHYLRPECCTDHLVETAVFTHKLLTKHGVVHWLDYGSLLGAVRDGKMIPWDTDVDFGFLGSELERVVSLGSEIAARGYQLDLGDPRMVRINFSSVNTQHIDLFPWVERDGTMLMDPHPGGEWPGMHGRDAFPRRFLDNLGTVTLHGYSMPVPSPVGEFLAEHRYGPDYMTPRRAVPDLWRLPEISGEDMNESVTRLIEELGRAERKRMALSERSVWKRLPGWPRWVSSGLPLAPSRRICSSIMESLVDEADRGRDVVVQLVEELARTRHFVEELEHPSPSVAATHMARRAVRAYHKLRRILAQRWAASSPTGT
ncbi:MAG TPA: LicD family protein [Acidimicrobiales bacterium]|nr:LicD family protein [Acidimicrobiales bacterium]